MKATSFTISRYEIDCLSDMIKHIRKNHPTSDKLPDLIPYEERIKQLQVDWVNVLDGTDALILTHDYQKASSYRDQGLAMVNEAVSEINAEIQKLFPGATPRGY